MGWWADNIVGPWSAGRAAKATAAATQATQAGAQAVSHEGRMLYKLAKNPIKYPATLIGITGAVITAAVATPFAVSAIRGSRAYDPEKAADPVLAEDIPEVFEAPDAPRKRVVMGPATARYLGEVGAGPDMSQPNIERNGLSTIDGRPVGALGGRSQP